MHKHISPSLLRQNLRVLLFGSVLAIASFAVGIETAGDIEPIALIQAGSNIPGDVDGDGMLSVRDVLMILDVAQGYAEATPENLKADPTDDGALTVDDALRVLRQIENR